MIKINLKKRALSLLLTATISAGLASSMISTAGAASNDYTTWKQQDSAWNQTDAWPKWQYPNATAYTFSQAGCLVTSIAMLLRHYNIETADVNTFNPWVLNERLKAVGGFDSAANLVYGSIEKVYPAFKFAGTKSYSKATLDYLYTYGYACILQVKGSGGYSHYVAVKSINGDTVEIMDPGYSSRSTLADYQGQASSILYYSTSGYAPNAASTQTIANGIYYLQSGLNNKKVVDIDSASKNAQLWDIGYTSNQQFQVQYQGNGYYTIKSMASGQALDAIGRENASNVWCYPANGSDAQLWKITASKNGYYNIVSKLNGLLLDVSNAETKNSTNLQNYRQNGTAAQDWKFVPLNAVNSNSASTEYFPKYTGYTTSIVDALNSLGIDSSYTHRKQIASSNNIQNYSGTFAQNTQMLSLLRQGKLKK